MKKFLCFILVLSTGLSSCVKDVILDANEEPLLVVACILSQDSVQTLQLSWTKGPSQAEAPLVTEAVAVLTDLTENREAGRFDRRGEGLWQLDYTPLTGHSYRLDVAVPGHEPVWAEQTVPEVPEVDISVTKRPEYPNPPKNGDKWGLQYGLNLSRPVWAWAENYDAEQNQHVPVKQLSTDYPYVDDLNVSGELDTDSNWPFPGTPMSGDMGSYDEYCTYQQVFHHRFLRFPKSDYPKALVSVGGKFRGDYYNYNDDSPREPSGKEGVLYFASLSDDYDRYLCEAFKYYQGEVSDDLSSIYIRDNVYTNIHGGVGIFGSFTQIPVRWDRAYVMIHFEDGKIIYP
ncbi:MAG: DUF4249 family protein [Bacteroidales bacterium]|nr:DUF4249 family protein [Bacteroidales bacterium]